MIHPQFAKFARSPSPITEMRLVSQAPYKCCIRLKNSSNSYQRLKKSIVFDANLAYIHKLKEQRYLSKAQSPNPKLQRDLDAQLLRPIALEATKKSLKTYKNLVISDLLSHKKQEKLEFEKTRSRFNNIETDSGPGRETNKNSSSKLKKKQDYDRILKRRVKKTIINKAIQAEDERISPWEDKL